MPTRVEKEIRVKKDKDLLNYIYSSIDRAQYENAGISKNLLFQEFEKTEEGRKTKLDSARGYAVDQLEHLVNMRFALKEMHLRLLKLKKTCHNMAVSFEKLRGTRHEQPEVTLPDLWNLDLVEE